jgi:hypothetical protein
MTGPFERSVLANEKVMFVFWVVFQSAWIRNATVEVLVPILSQSESVIAKVLVLWIRSILHHPTARVLASAQSRP